MRSTARLRFSSRVALVDAEKILSDASAGGIIGADLIYEHVHMTPEGNYLLARAIFAQIALALPQGTGASEPLSEAECERLLALTGFDRWRLANDMFGRLQKAPFTNQLNHSEQLFHFAGVPSLRTRILTRRWCNIIGQLHNIRMTLCSIYVSVVSCFLTIATPAEQIGMAQPWDGYPRFLPDGTQVR